MRNKIILGAVIALILIVAAGSFWVKAVFTGETARAALAAQVARALGQPVSIGRVDASIFPRVTVTLGDVTIGQPARATVTELHIATDFRALLSRRIEHATLRLAGARIELPLPPLALDVLTIVIGHELGGRDRVDRRDRVERRRSRQRRPHSQRRHRSGAAGSGAAHSQDRAGSRGDVDRRHRSTHRSRWPGRRAQRQGGRARPRPAGGVRQRLHGRQHRSRAIHRHRDTGRCTVAHEPGPDSRGRARHAWVR